MTPAILPVPRPGQHTRNGEEQTPARNRVEGDGALLGAREARRSPHGFEPHRPAACVGARFQVRERIA